MNQPNVYEQSPGALQAESERLRTFDMPTQVSIEAISDVQPGTAVLDIGSGENPSLNKYVHDRDATYVAFDIRAGALAEQQAEGALALMGDARELPIADESLDVVHARFVLGHFSTPDRAQIMNEAMRCLKPDGKAVFIDYDWTAMHGSDAINQLRDFTIQNIGVFDAAYGARSTSETAANLSGAADVTELRKSSPLLADYTGPLKLREITLKGLEASHADTSLVAEANAIFNALEAESRSDDAPGFYMPDMVATIVHKPAA